VCAHPYAAWRVGSAPVRAWVVVAYFSASYLAIFSALALLPAAR